MRKETKVKSISFDKTYFFRLVSQRNLIKFLKTIKKNLVLIDFTN